MTTPTKPSSQDLLQYFATALERGGLENVDFTGAAYAEIPRASLDDNEALPEADTERLFNASKRHNPSELEVVISLVTLQANGNHHGLLLLQAKLSKSGKLTPVLQAGSSPWIPAHRLEGASTFEPAVLVGNVQDFREYTRKHADAKIFEGAQSLSAATRVADQLFSATCSKSIEDFAADVNSRRTYGGVGQYVDHDTCYVREYDRISATRSLLQLYDWLAREKTLPPLLDRMLQSAPARSPEIELDQDDLMLDAALRSCGSMSSDNPLTNSQRRAVHAFVRSTDGEISGVAGPPGTGKTTMLQSIVASLMVGHALEEKQAPVIVGTSTNNQAVTNIIKSFGSVAKQDPGPLESRWLPDATNGDRRLPSLGVYYPSNAKLKEAKNDGYLIETSAKSETYAQYTDPEYVRNAEQLFSEAATNFFGTSLSIKTAQERILAELRKIDALRRELLNKFQEMQTDASRQADFFERCERALASQTLQKCTDVGKLQKLSQSTTLRELDKHLDTTLRYAEFWLAVHFYEAGWLLAKDDHMTDESERWKTLPWIRDRYWSQAAMLTPVFVMTVFQMPKHFTTLTQQDEPSVFMASKADLLIVDEAGQVDTPLGIPLFALAKRAVVVGDEQQISPVWSMDEATDAGVAGAAGMSSEIWNTDLLPRGLGCSKGASLMRAASWATAWSHVANRTTGTTAPGLFLSEHFRCKNEIIDYCNDLLYGGTLTPSRVAPSKLETIDPIPPAFAWVDVPGSFDRSPGSSRLNPVEAEKIAEWIAQNASPLVDIYDPDGEKCLTPAGLIGVVTPFAAQAREIQRALREHDPSLANSITIGTAHRLQGAERSVVLYSPVYGENSTEAPFIENEPALTNVAVSRAKDLFIVFGARNRRNTEAGRVFKLMQDHSVVGPVSFTPPSADPVPHIHADDVSIEDSHFGMEAAQALTPAPTLRPEPAADRLTSEPLSDIDATTKFELPTVSADSNVGTASATAAPKTTRQPHEPERSQAASNSSETLALTKLLDIWRIDGVLRADDEKLKAQQVNPRLAAAGLIMKDEAVGWRPTLLGQAIGIRSVERTKTNGEVYFMLSYDQQTTQQILRRLYELGGLPEVS